MVDFPINTGIRKIADFITTPVDKIADEEWFAESITVLLSSVNVIATLVIDFAYDTSTIVEYTLDDGINWIFFEKGKELIGGTSVFADVTTGIQFNVRAKTAGKLIRCIVSSVP